MLIAASALVSVVGLAQAAPQQPSDAQREQAAQLVDEMLAKYQGLESYSDQSLFTIEATGNKAFTEEVAENERREGSLAFERPGKFRLESPEYTAGSDGETLVVVDREAETFTKKPVEGEIQPDEILPDSGQGGAMMSAPALSMLLGQDTQDIRALLEKLQSFETRQVDGRELAVITVDAFGAAAMGAEMGPEAMDQLRMLGVNEAPRVPMELYIDPESKLLQRVRVDATGMFKMILQAFGGMMRQMAELEARGDDGQISEEERKQIDESIPSVDQLVITVDLREIKTGVEIPADRFTIETEGLEQVEALDEGVEVEMPADDGPQF